MSTVSNAGPLISLARIDRLHLLPALYIEILIPPAVRAEITGDRSRPGETAFHKADWLRTVEIADYAVVQQLRVRLDRGESEAIALAQELDALLLMDERRGRSVARARGATFTGTVGILIAAKVHGHVEAVVPLLDDLIANGIRISPRLYREASELSGER